MPPVSSPSMISARPLIPIIPQLSHSYIQQLNKEDKFTEKDDDFKNPSEENLKQSEWYKKYPLIVIGRRVVGPPLHSCWFIR